MKNRFAIAALALMVGAFSLVAYASEKGWFGFVVEVETGGFPLSPTLRSVRIKDVVPSSPAAQTLAGGDVVTAVEGVPVADAKASAIQALLHKNVGETLRLTIKRGAEESREVTLTAAAKPETATK